MNHESSQNRDHFLIQDYDQYEMKKQEKLKYFAIAAGILFTVGFLFYNNLILSLALSFLAIFYPDIIRHRLVHERKEELRIQFRDAMYSISSALAVGRSLENAFRSALNDLIILYPEPETMIIVELEYLCKKLELNVPIEIILEDLARRSKIDDINSFAQVVSICKKNGGNMVKVMSNTANVIREKIEVQQEIRLSFSKQKYEQKLMNIMPFVFIILLRLGGSGYINPLFGNLKGMIITTLSLSIIALSYYFSEKIMNIRM